MALTFIACGLCVCVRVCVWGAAQRSSSVVNHTHHRKVGGVGCSHSLWS